MNDVNDVRFVHSSTSYAELSLKKNWFAAAGASDIPTDSVYIRTANRMFEMTLSWTT